MARGLPAVWSTVLSAPFLAGGAYFYFLETPYPRLVGLPLMAFGAFVFLVGLYIHFVAAPPPPDLRDEEIVAVRHPSQRVAISKIAISTPFLGATAYLLFFTRVPYVYPTIAFLAGLYLFSGGLVTYWINTLTTYYVTTKRILHEYRFLALSRKELPLSKIRGVEERKSPIEALVGLGNIRIASAGGGGSVEVVVKNIADSDSFANELRGLIH